MDKTYKALIFDSSLDELVDLNSSFAKGVMQIAYHGENRNGTYISKEDFEKAIPSIYNTPIVCRYDRETDSIGSHDVEVVKKNDVLTLVNITEPVGVVPESANVYWKEIEEPDGVVHEYLCADVLLWKRQEAYGHIRDNGITSESMEIDVFNGAMMDDDLYHITNFQFTAFCLLESANPCFESAGVEVFALDGFKTKFSQMMEDLKKEYAINISLKGGNEKLNVDELMQKYGLTQEDVDFELAGLGQEEIEARFAEIRDRKNFDGEDDPADPDSDSADATDPDSDPTDEGADESENDAAGDDSDTTTDEVGDPLTSKTSRSYFLTNSQFTDELRNALSDQTFIDHWGDKRRRYWLIDFDYELCEVYAMDDADHGRLYGFHYDIEDDKPVIDFATGRRKKIQYVDFAPDETQETAFDLEALEAEIYSCARKRVGDENAIFAQFSDLVGNEMFEALKAACDQYSLDTIEEKCFAIRGRSVQTAKFGLSGVSLRVPAGMGKPGQDADEPYNGAFKRYLRK